MDKNIKVVFSDIDQTLYSHVTKRVPTSAIHAIEDMQKKGIKFFYVVEEIFIWSGRREF